MLLSRNEVQRVIDLANRIEADIRRRRLNAGDRYLTTPETAKSLGVDARLANRALQLFVKRKRLQRRTKLGTVVLDPETKSQASQIERVNLLSGNRRKTVDIMVDSGELLGLQEELPNAKIQISVVPPDNELAYLNAMVTEAIQSRGTEVFVLQTSSIAMQRVISASGLPAVVQGSVYPSVKNLPTINSDHDHAAKLATEYVLKKGHRRIAILARQWQSPLGDGMSIEGIYRAAHRGGLEIGDIDLRFLPEDAEVGAAITAELLADAVEPPALMAFSKIVADAACEFIENQGLKVGSDVTVVTLDYPVLPNDLPNYPFVERTMSSVEVGVELGRMLTQSVADGPAATANFVIPVRLWIPGDER
jgi:DNA-binding LacI/PurR family transcriptional regulator